MATNMLYEWLEEAITRSHDNRYWHRSLSEKHGARARAVEVLTELVNVAHEDTRKYLRAALGDSLDPLSSDVIDPAEDYPRALSYKTLYGYFGEVLAGIVAEKFAAFGFDRWHVPAYLFRFDLPGLQELERIRQGKPAKLSPGRTGDDCLAFIRGLGHVIEATLVCEAKCTGDHDAGMIGDAHEKVSKELPTPVDLPQLIRILSERSDADSIEWAQALRLLYLRGPARDYEAMNLVIYVSGRKPKAKESWMSRERPHNKYVGRRRLEAIEVHLNDVQDLVSRIYGKS